MNLAKAKETETVRSQWTTIMITGINTQSTLDVFFVKQEYLHTSFLRIIS